MSLDPSLRCWQTGWDPWASRQPLHTGIHLGSVLLQNYNKKRPDHVVSDAVNLLLSPNLTGAQVPRAAGHAPVELRALV